MTALQNLCEYVWGAFSYPSVQENCPFPTAGKLPSHTGALVAILGWVPHTQCFKTGWKHWAEAPCGKPGSFPVKQNELFMNFLVLVTFKFSKSLICHSLPSASSPVVSSTVDEASLGFSQTPCCKDEYGQLFSTPQCWKKLDNLRDLSKSQPQNHDMLC